MGLVSEKVHKHAFTQRRRCEFSHFGFAVTIMDERVVSWSRDVFFSFFLSVNTVGGWCIQQAVCGNMGSAELLGRGEGKKEGRVKLMCLMPSQVKPYNNSVQDGLLLQLSLPFIVKLAT